MALVAVVIDTPMYDDKVLLALLSIIGTLIGILGFVIKNELGRIRDSSS